MRHLVRDLAIALDRHQRARGRQPVERLAQVLAHDTLDLGRRCHHGVERTVLLQQLDRGLGPDLFHPRDVVHAVADQRQVVDDARRRHAELGLHAGHIQRLAAHRVDKRGLVVDQLRHVLVAGRDHRAYAMAARVLGQRADHVIGLDALDHHHRPAECAHRVMDRRDLPRQVGRHLGAIGLVLRIERVAERLAGRVEHAGAVVRRHLLAQRAQHVDVAAQRAHRLALRGAQIGHRVKCTVEVARPVDQQQCLHRFESASFRPPVPAISTPNRTEPP